MWASMDRGIRPARTNEKNSPSMVEHERTEQQVASSFKLKIGCEDGNENSSRHALRTKNRICCKGAPRVNLLGGPCKLVKDK